MEYPGNLFSDAGPWCHGPMRMRITASGRRTAAAFLVGLAVAVLPAASTAALAANATTDRVLAADHTVAGSVVDSSTGPCEASATVYEVLGVATIRELARRSLAETVLEEED